MPSEEFDDDLIGDYSGAGVIFGVTGGVMEAALRTAYYILTSNELEPIEFTPCRGLEGIKEASLKILGNSYNVAMASGMKNAKILLDEIKEGKSKYDFIEIMGCPGGCVNGGGQPYVTPLFLPKEEDNILDTYVAKRAKVLYEEDRNRKIRRSHLNPDIKKLYNDYLGEYGSKKAHKLLHTYYNSSRERYPDLKIGE